MGINDVPKTELIERAARELQKVNSIQPPDWSLFAKTGMFKQRQPTRNDWWFVRAAAILRRLASSNGPIGVQKLRTLYGGKKNLGHAPEHFYKGSGNIIRKILQQLDKAGFSKRIDKGEHKGRIITPQGASFLGRIADQMMKEQNFVLPKKPEAELQITELPKEKSVRKRAARKKAETPAGDAGTEAPKRRRAPKKKTEVPAESSQAPAPAPQPSAGQANQPANQ
jgi:small subunit ribosomal protein S19e